MGGRPDQRDGQQQDRQRRSSSAAWLASRRGWLVEEGRAEGPEPEEDPEQVTEEGDDIGREGRLRRSPASWSRRFPARSHWRDVRARVRRASRHQLGVAPAGLGPASRCETGGVGSIRIVCHVCSRTTSLFIDGNSLVRPTPSPTRLAVPDYASLCPPARRGVGCRGRPCHGGPLRASIISSSGVPLELILTLSRRLNKVLVKIMVRFESKWRNPVLKRVLYANLAVLRSAWRSRRAP